MDIGQVLASFAAIVACYLLACAISTWRKHKHAQEDAAIARHILHRMGAERPAREPWPDRPYWPQTERPVRQPWPKEPE